MGIVEDKVAQVISTYGTRDPWLIAARANITVLEGPLPKRLKAFLFRENNLVGICLNELMTYKQKNTALAHELGHFFLHSQYQFCLNMVNYNTSAKAEKQADLFAVKLLVESFDGEPWELSEHYNISEDILLSVAYSVRETHTTKRNHVAPT